jgi:hypothetical protein
MPMQTPIPNVPAASQDDSCPRCRGPLTEPGDQQFTQLGASTFVPSKVCEACKIGYFMTRVGWAAVATFE